MTNEEWAGLAAEYQLACNEPMPTTVPRDFGHVDIDEDDFFAYAKSAIASGKPINWREILGPTLQEQDPLLVS